MKHLIVIFSLLIFTLFPSCAHIQYTHERLSLPRHAFVEILTTASERLCDDNTCGQNKGSTVSSAAIIHVEPQGSYIIGANHVCALKEKETTSVEVKFTVMGTAGTSHRAHILTTDPPNDLCVMFAPGLTGVAVKVREHPPRYGEKVYNLASPAGAAYPPHNTPVYMGFYSGKRGNWDMYTIPATGGSSGSPIIDVNGHMVGIIQAHLQGFKHLTISSNYHRIKKMIDEVVSGRLSMRIFND